MGTSLPLSNKVICGPLHDDILSNGSTLTILFRQVRAKETQRESNFGDVSLDKVDGVTGERT